MSSLEQGFSNFLGFRDPLKGREISIFSILFNFYLFLLLFYYHLWYEMPKKLFILNIKI